MQWTAPEALQKERITTNQDVWSFGVLFWEILCNGEIPYKGYHHCCCFIPYITHITGFSNEDIISYVHEGNRLPMPSSCPPAIQSLLNECWKSDPMVHLCVLASIVITVYCSAVLFLLIVNV